MKLIVDLLGAMLSKTDMDNNQIIDAIPREALIQRFGLSRQRLHIWRKRGVPKSKRIAYGRLAVDCGVALPQSFFDEADQ